MEHQYQWEKRIISSRVPFPNLGQPLLLYGDPLALYGHQANLADALAPDVLGRQLYRQRDYLATYPPDPLPLLREGGVWVREGQSPSLKSLPPHAKNTSPYCGEGDKGGEVNKQSAYK